MSTKRIDDSGIVTSSAVSTIRSTGDVVRAETVVHTSTLVDTRIVLNGEVYTVVKRIASSGEAEIFLVSSGKHDLVFKYYFSNYSLKDQIVEKLKLLKRKDIMSPMETGIHLGRFYELSEYMRGGTLETLMPIKDSNYFKNLLFQLVEAIHACHQNGIIHRDIKPVNIFFRTAQKDELVLGDFGIASALRDGEDYRFTTSVNRTNSYAAPELFTNIDNQTTLDSKVDYYALGISILELWTGQDPFKGIAEFMAMRIKIEGRVRIPMDIPSEIQQLIKGLITTEPPKRWGHAQIQKWFRGEAVDVHQTEQQTRFRPYEWDRINNIIVNDPKELANFMQRDLFRAAKQLYSKSILDWIKPASTDLYSELNHITEKEYPNTNERNTRAGVVKTIYILDRERGFSGLDGVVCNSTKEVARHLEANSSYYRGELKNKSANLYLFLEARGFADRIKKYLAYYKQFNEEKAFNLLVLDLDDNQLNLKNQVYEHLQQLMQAGPEVLAEILSQIRNEDSRVSLWTDIHYSNLSGSIVKWKNEPAFQNVSTLAYAFQTGGFTCNDRQANSAAEFYILLKEHTTYFTEGPEAVKNLDLAQYWLKNYQSASLISMIGGFLQNESAHFDTYLALYRYLLSQTPGDPVMLMKDLALNLKKNVGGNTDNLLSISKLTADAIEVYLTRNRDLHVFALGGITNMISALVDVKDIYPDFAIAVAANSNDFLSEAIDADLLAISKNSDTFWQYRTELSLRMQDLSVIDSSLPVYQHWKSEEKLIAHQKTVIDKKHKDEFERDLKLVNSKFSDYAKDQLELNLNYQAKSRLYFQIMMLSVGVIMSYFILVYYLGAFQLLKGLEAIIAVAIFMAVGVLLPILTQRGAGLGDFHIWFGKLLYRPVLKLRLNSASDATTLATQDQKNHETQKLESRCEARRANDLFEESVRIVLLRDDDLLRQGQNI